MYALAAAHSKRTRGGWSSGPGTHGHPPALALVRTALARTEWPRHGSGVAITRGAAAWPGVVPSDVNLMCAILDAVYTYTTPG